MSEELNPSQETTNETSAATPRGPDVSPTLSTLQNPQTVFEPRPAWRVLVAPAWFFFGILVGLGLFAAYVEVTSKPGPQTLDAAHVKQAAREGLLEAIQELQAQSSGNSGQGPQAVDKNAFAVRDANLLGNKDAKVSIVEFADFQCPFCGRHHQSVEPTLIRDYVNTGKANLSYKHLAFLGPESVYAATAAECAADQGKFWEYHDYLFERQNGENQGAFAKDKLIAFGKDLGLDQPRFEKCVSSDETVARVQTDTEEAQKLGVGSTPTFFVNGAPLVGLKSSDEFKRAIEQALSQ